MPDQQTDADPEAVLQRLQEAVTDEQRQEIELAAIIETDNRPTEQDPKL
jgi:hypothetical protein